MKHRRILSQYPLYSTTVYARPANIQSFKLAFSNVHQVFGKYYRHVYQLSTCLQPRVCKYVFDLQLILFRPFEMQSKYERRVTQQCDTLLYSAHNVV